MGELGELDEDEQELGEYLECFLGLDESVLGLGESGRGVLTFLVEL